jgi:type II restriction enzyme
LVKYDILGFKNESKYLNYFFKTILKTNQTYEYFIDWIKVKEKATKF